ncbi:MAG: hypothetical protein K2J40_01190 [Ruminococcus sp.]|nr:hypothetical protein [Ruminococcus sp.]
MKKLISLLAVCAMITCTLGSCGKEESSETSTEKSVSEAETTEASTEEETTETTTETTTQPETEVVTEAEVSAEDILGMWSMEDDGMTMGFDFKDNGSLTMWIDISEMIHFSTDGEFVVDGEAMDSSFISYDGTTFSFNVEGQDLWTMTRESGSDDSFDGEYKLVSGVMYDSVALADGADVYVTVSGEVLLADYRNALSYTINGDTITMNGLEIFGYDKSDSADVKYEIKGDTLILKDFDEDSDWNMTRFDLSVGAFNKTETDTNVSTDGGEGTTEGSILGAWYAVDSAYGFVFDENGTGGMFVDTTEKLHFKADGGILFGNMSLESDCISYDGTNLSATFQGINVLTMKRDDAGSPDSFDGKYTIISGDFYEGLASQLNERFGTTPENSTLCAIVDGEKMYIEISDIFTYTADNGEISFKGLMAGMGIPDDTTINYEFSGKNLIFKNMADSEMSFEKIDL